MGPQTDFIFLLLLLLLLIHLAIQTRPSESSLGTRRHFNLSHTATSHNNNSHNNYRNLHKYSPSYKRNDITSHSNHHSHQNYTKTHNEHHHRHHNHTSHKHQKRQSHQSHLYSNPENGFCRSISDCPIGSNLTCLRVFDDCVRGVCACDPSVTVMKDNRCVSVSLGGSPCTPSSTTSTCAKYFECVGGICRCPRGHFMTNDKKHCLKDGSRLVGQSCSPPLQAANRERCLRKSGDSFSSDYVTCSAMTSLCQCGEGYKRHRESCVPRQIGEFGCVRSSHCKGGAVCIDGRCVCPTGYSPDRELHKCIRKGAASNLMIGDECDELNEKAYCAPSLVCARCPHEKTEKCIKILLTDFYGNKGDSTKFNTRGVVLMMIMVIIEKDFLVN